MSQQESLSRRERQIMNVIYTSGSADVQHVVDALADPPSYTSVRTMLRLLEDKGHLTHSKNVLTGLDVASATGGAGARNSSKNTHFQIPIRFQS